MKAPTILVFGAGGQLGLSLQDRAKTSDQAVRFLTRTEADIVSPRDVENALAASGAALVVNAAAYTNVDQAEVERDQAFHANEAGPRVLAEACVKASIPLIHVSTDYVFDGRKADAYVETDETGPINIYGHSKLAGEAAIAATLREHVILRASWLFGVHGRNFLKTMLTLADERDELRVVADQQGCPTSTSDLAEAILGIAPRLIAREPVWGVYHYASPHPATWHGFASAIIDAQAKLTGRRPVVTAISTEDYPTKAARPYNSVLDSEKFFSVFGMRAKDWRERVAEAVPVLCEARTA